MAKTQQIHFRVPDELLERLDAQAAALGVSRAGLIRLLVQQGMGDSTQVAFLREASYKAHGVILATVARAVGELNERFPAHLEAQMVEAGLTANAAE